VETEKRDNERRQGNARKKAKEKNPFEPLSGKSCRLKKRGERKSEWGPIGWGGMGVRAGRLRLETPGKTARGPKNQGETK